VTKEKARKLLPIFKAYFEGRTIQIKTTKCGNGYYWQDLAHPYFDADPTLYRVKPSRFTFQLSHQSDTQTPSSQPTVKS